MSEVSDVTIIQVFFLRRVDGTRDRLPDGFVAFVVYRLAFPLVD